MNELLLFKYDEWTIDCLLIKYKFKIRIILSFDTQDSNINQKMYKYMKLSILENWVMPAA